MEYARVRSRFSGNSTSWSYGVGKGNMLGFMSYDFVVLFLCLYCGLYHHHPFVLVLVSSKFMHENPSYIDLSPPFEQDTQFD